MRHPQIDAATVASTPNANLRDKTGAYLRFSDIPETERSERRSCDVTLASLHSCVVDLLPDGSTTPIKLTALYARGLKQCVVWCGVIQGSVRLEDCIDCVFVLACHQVQLLSFLSRPALSHFIKFRMEHCRSTDIYLGVTSLPVIEESSGLRFAALPVEFNERVGNGLSQQVWLDRPRHLRES